AKPYAGHILLPAPKGIILISFPDIISNGTVSSKNLSGLNDIGSTHASGSRPISATIKFTIPSSDTEYPPPSSVVDFTACGSKKCPGGWRRSPSSTTAFRYGNFRRSSSSITVFSVSPISNLISSNSLVCMLGYFTRFAMIH
ncbi:hypothetical protein LINGRAHAP2_LOCUS1333, partial [Linum grandiflorum]